MRRRRLAGALALLCQRGAAQDVGPFDVLFNHSLKRERAARSVAAWRRTRKTPIDLLIGNYLSDYFRALAEAITARQPRFRRPRRTDGHPFYERCLPKALVLSPWRADLPAVRPAGRWDWFVFDNETDAFWSSMRPLATRVLDAAFAKCGLDATVGAPVIHFRCASAPLNRQSQYHFQRYSFYRAAARKYRRRFGAPLRRVHLLTCVADDVNRAGQTAACTAYVSDLAAFLRAELGVEVLVSNCAHSMFEDFAIMYHAPFLVSTGSTMSLLPGLLRHAPRRTFVSPRLFDEASIAINSHAPGRRTGCVGCDWMLNNEHTLCHCEVEDYSREPAGVAATVAALRLPPLPQAAAARAALRPPALCARCAAARCATFLPYGACAVAPPSVAEAAAAAPRRQPETLPRGLGCAAAGGRPMTEAECRRAAARQGYGRRWLGGSMDAGEAAGCVAWEDGNVEFNRHSPAAAAQRCVGRGTCLCHAGTQADGAPAELHVVGV